MLESITLLSALSLAIPAGLPGVVPQEAGSPELAVRFVDSDAHAFAEEERRVIRGLAAEAVAEVAALLPGTPERIELVVEAGARVIPETGDGGAAVAPGRISWMVDPDRPGGVLAIARARLRSTLFHEIHHLVRGWTFEGGTAGSRMIDAAVSEGMATAFERDAAGWDPPWGAYPPEAGEWIRELLAVESLASYGTWMFEHPDGRRWIGYRAGTWLADRAIAESGLSAAELVTTPTDEILALAGVQPRR